MDQKPAFGCLKYSEQHAPGVGLTLDISEILASEQSAYQRITFYRNPYLGVFFTLDGYIQLTEGDEFAYHDMIVHPAMAVNPQIKNVLVIGGGDGGTVRELCRYPTIEKIIMVEIDERVVRLSQKFLPSTASVIDNDSRLTNIYEDGLTYIKNSASAQLDLIIVDSTDPIGSGEGLFSREFYHNCHRALNKNGILINQHESAFYPWDGYEMKRANDKIKSVFPIAKVYGFNMPSYASGYWYFGFAAKNLDPVSDIKAEQWQNFSLETKYYNIELHKAAFALPSYVKKLLSE